MDDEYFVECLYGEQVVQVYSWDAIFYNIVKHNPITLNSKIL